MQNEINNMQPPLKAQRPSIFISYARGDDEEFVRRLYEDLSKEQFDVWFDRESMPSRQLTFHQEIRDAISQCQRLLLVVGPKAITSDYVRQEWQFAYYSAEKCINPIVRLDGTAENGEPINGYSLIPAEFEKLDAEDFRDDRDYDRHLKRLVRNLADDLPPVGKLVGIPELPPGFRAQQDRLNSLRDILLLDLRQPVVVSGAAARVGLHGMGGIGKSFLANSVARDPEVKRGFKDGLYWVHVGQQPDVVSLQRKLVRQLGGDCRFGDSASGKEEIRALLKDRAALLILDDIWRREHAEVFNVAGACSRILLTTRDAGLVAALVAKENQYQVHLPTMAEAEAIIASAAQQDVRDLPEEAKETITACGRLPLALALCGGMVQSGRTWGDVLEALREHDLEYPSSGHYAEEQHENLWKAMNASVSVLSEDQRERFTDLAVLNWDSAVPEEAVVTLWEQTGNMTPRAARNLLAGLVQRSLVQRVSSTVSETVLVNLHDLVRNFAEGAAVKRSVSLKDLHRTLLEAYRSKCTDGWPSGSDDGYFFDNLANHLLAAGNHEDLSSLFADQDWMDARFKTSGNDYYGYLSDLSVLFDMTTEKLRKDENYLSSCIKHGLIRASIHSLVANYDNDTVIEAVETGEWSPGRARRLAERMAHGGQKYRLTSRLAQIAGADCRDTATDRSVEITPQIRNKAKLAIALATEAQKNTGAERLTLLRQASEAASEIRDKSSEVTILVEIAGHLTGSERKEILLKALNTSLTIRDEQEKVESLKAVIRELKGAEYSSALRVACNAARTIKGKSRQVDLLVALADQLDEAEREKRARQALDIARRIPDEKAKVAAFIKVAEHLNGAVQRETLERAQRLACKIWDNRCKVEALCAIAEQLDGAERTETLRLAKAAVDRIRDVKLWTETAIILARQFDGAEKSALLQHVLSAAGSILDEQWQERIRAVVKELLDGLTDTPLQERLGAALTIRDEGWQAIALSALAGKLDAGKGDAILRQALPLAFACEDKTLQAKALIAVGKELNGEERPATLRQARDAALTIDDPLGKVSTLVDLAEHLGEAEKSAVLSEAFTVSAGITEKGRRAKAFAVIAGKVDGTEDAELLSKFLAATQLLSKTRRLKVLLALPSKLSGLDNSSQWRDALADIHKNADISVRATALTSLAKQLHGAEKARILLDALNAARGIKNPASKAEALTAIAGLLEGMERDAVIQEARSVSSSIQDHDFVRAKSLAGMALHVDKITAIQLVIECLQCLKNSSRTDFLRITAKMLPSLDLQEENYEAIAWHLNDICSNWRWS